MKIVDVTGEDDRDVTGGDASSTDAFEPADAFAGPRPGRVFRLGDRGLGYYPDDGAARSARAPAGASDRHASADGSDGGDAADDGGDGSFSVDLFDRYHERLLARLGALSPLVDAGEVTIHVLSAWPHGRCRSTERPPEVAAAADEKVDEKVVAVRCDVGASVEWRATVTLGVSPGASVLGTVSGRVKVASARLRSDGGVEVSAPETLLAGEKSAAEREREEERSAGRGADDLAEKADDLALDDAAPLERAAGASLEDRARAAMDAGGGATRVAEAVARSVADVVAFAAGAASAASLEKESEPSASFDAGKERKEEEDHRAADFFAPRRPPALVAALEQLRSCAADAPRDAPSAASASVVTLARTELDEAHFFDDLVPAVAACASEEAPRELDLSRTNASDAAVQRLVAALASGAAPALKTLRLAGNDRLTAVSDHMLKGLAAMRKELEVAR